MRKVRGLLLLAAGLTLSVILLSACSQMMRSREHTKMPAARESSLRKPNARDMQITTGEIAPINRTRE